MRRSPADNASFRAAHMTAPVPIFDAHAHLDMPEFAADLPDVLERAARAGVGKVLCVGTDLDSSLRCVDLARRFPGLVYAAVGIHPNHWAQAGPGDMERIGSLCTLAEVVAIGETGLDFHHGFTDRHAQARGLREHLRLVVAAGKPVIIHVRKADEEALKALSEAGGQFEGVRHCFEGTAQTVERYLRQGLHVSFTAAVTRPGHRKLKEAARLVPAERLLVETDCPYQTPASHAGERNEPAFITETIQALAVLRSTTPEALAATTARNAESLFFPGLSMTP